MLTGASFLTVTICRLLLFLCQDHCMQELVRMITTEPPAGIEETKRFKYVLCRIC